MTNTMEWLTKQIKDAATKYFDQDLESFFLPKEGDKTLHELVQRSTGFETTRVSSYAYGSMVELEMVQYRDRRSKVISSKFKVAVKCIIEDGNRKDIKIEFGY